MAKEPKPSVGVAALIEKHKSEWPADLLAKAERARLTLRSIELNTNPVPKALVEQFNTDLTAFYEAYSEWRAGNGEERK